MRHCHGTASYTYHVLGKSGVSPKPQHTNTIQSFCFGPDFHLQHKWSPPRWIHVQEQDPEYPKPQMQLQHPNYRPKARIVRWRTRSMMSTFLRGMKERKGRTKLPRFRMLNLRNQKSLLNLFFAFVQRTTMDRLWSCAPNAKFGTSSINSFSSIQCSPDRKY